MELSKTTNKFSDEVRERAVRMVPEHQGQSPFSAMHFCSTPLHN